MEFESKYNNFNFGYCVWKRVQNVGHFVETYRFAIVRHVPLQGTEIWLQLEQFHLTLTDLDLHPCHVTVTRNI